MKFLINTSLLFALFVTNPISTFAVEHTPPTSTSSPERLDWYASRLRVPLQDVQEYGLWRISLYGQKAQSLAPTVKEMLTNSDIKDNFKGKFVREGAARCLARIARPKEGGEYLFKLMRNTANPTIVDACAKGVAVCGKEGIEVAISGLSHQDPRGRVSAIRALTCAAQEGFDTSAATGQIQEISGSDPDAEARKEAFQYSEKVVHGGIRPVADMESPQSVATMLQSTDDEVILAGIRRLAAMGPKASPVLDEIKGKLGHKNWIIGYYAGIAIVDVMGAKKAALYLNEVYTNTSSSVALLSRASWALVFCGDEGARLLAQGLTSLRRDVRLQSLDGLRGIVTKEGVDTSFAESKINELRSKRDKGAKRLADRYFTYKMYGTSAPKTNPGEATMAERLKQVKSLFEQGLISEEDYDKKVKEIIDSL